MSMFASIASKDIPWRAGQKVETFTDSADGTHYTLVRREFHQHNEPNPILVAFRQWLTIASWSTASEEALDWLDYARSAPRFEGESFKLYWAARMIAATEQVTHARRVLTRLANLRKESA
jgi:hypothetical protein